MITCVYKYHRNRIVYPAQDMQQHQRMRLKRGRCEYFFILFPVFLDLTFNIIDIHYKFPWKTLEKLIFSTCKCQSILVSEDKQQHVIEAYFIDIVSRETSIATNDIKVDETFHELGLDSINAVFVMEKLEKEFDVSLSPLCFWDYPTIRLLSEYIEAIQNG